MKRADPARASVTVGIPSAVASDAVSVGSGGPNPRGELDKAVAFEDHEIQGDADQRRDDHGKNSHRETSISTRHSGARPARPVLPHRRAEKNVPNMRLACYAEPTGSD